MQDLRVVKRTGEVVEFDPDRIQAAIAKAVGATKHDLGEAKGEKIVDDVTVEVRTRFVDFYPNVENIQDIVEKHLVTGGYYEVSKSFILYRAERQKAREEATQRAIESGKPQGRGR